MNIKDKIGKGISNFLLPYMQNYNNRGGYMKQPMDREEYMLEEKYLWFLGNEDLLADFYRTKTRSYTVIDTRGEFYYSKVGSDIRVVHSGLPSLISYSKARLLMSGGLEFYANREDKKVEETTQLLQDVYDDNKMEDIIKSSITTESWGKRFAWKIGYDKDISEYPILEKYNPFDYKTTYKRGRLQEIVFFTYYEKDKQDYRLEEKYGKGFIQYQLYHVNKDGGEELVPLTDLEETAKLKNITWNEKIILGGEKCIDKSDYDGIVSEFDALDEAWSQLMDEIRLARSEVYIPEMLLTNKTFNKFRKNYAQLGNDERETGKNAIEHVQPDIRSEEYENTIRILTNNTLTSVGLSPFTVGIDDGIGANASGEQLAKRESTSLRTRNEMIDGWEPFLEEMFLILLFATQLFRNGKLNRLAKLDDSVEIQVSFGDYITPTRTEIINEVKIMKDADIIDNEKALKEIYGDELPDEEKTRILANTGNVSFEEEQKDEETPTEE
jgi:hypothetical protein